MDRLAFSFPGGQNLDAPAGVPTGGLGTTASNFLSLAINLMLILAVVLSVVFLLMGAIRWITSSGDPKGIDGARKQITFAIIGLIIAFAGFIIVNIVSQALSLPTIG
jgi:hypothetical protein